MPQLIDSVPRSSVKLCRADEQKQKKVSLCGVVVDKMESIISALGELVLRTEQHKLRNTYGGINTIFSIVHQRRKMH